MRPACHCVVRDSACKGFYNLWGGAARRTERIGKRALQNGSASNMRLTFGRCSAKDGTSFGKRASSGSERAVKVERVGYFLLFTFHLL